MVGRISGTAITLADCQAFGAGTAAMYDAHVQGLIPVTVLEVLEEGTGFQVTSGRLRLRCEQARPGFQLGEVFTAVGYHTIPRDYVYLRDGHYRIRPCYRWVRESDKSKELA